MDLKKFLEQHAPTPPGPCAHYTIHEEDGRTRLFYVAIRHNTHLDDDTHKKAMTDLCSAVAKVQSIYPTIDRILISTEPITDKMKEMFD